MSPWWLFRISTTQEMVSKCVPTDRGCQSQGVDDFIAALMLIGIIPLYQMRLAHRAEYQWMRILALATNSPPLEESESRSHYT